MKETRQRVEDESPMTQSNKTKIEITLLLLHHLVLPMKISTRTLINFNAIVGRW